MWFDHRLVLRASPIHGVGTFAVEDIGAGEQLMAVSGGLVFAQSDLEQGNFQISGLHYNQAELTKDLRIVTPVSFHYYINHSCAPNAVDLSRHPTNTQYVALRDIAAGEEITADYYTVETLEKCLCGSPQCRWRAA
jgi:SET domain-containing protein